MTELDKLRLFVAKKRRGEIAFDATALEEIKMENCLMPNYKCRRCEGISNNPYPYCPWCGRPNTNNMPISLKDHTVTVISSMETKEES